MVDVDKAVVAYFKVDGHRFEVLVDCDEAVKLKAGNDVLMKDVLAAERVYSDAKKGLLASESAVRTIFGTVEPEDVAREIILKGEVQLTAAHKKKLLDNKKKQIVDFIRVHGIDPRTNIPHPAVRIENAFEEAKVKIDEHKSAEQQIEQVLKSLRPVLPIKIASQELAVRIPALYAGKVYSSARQQVKVKSEDWQSDGSIILIVELPAGIRDDYVSRLNGLTHGSVEVKILRTL